MFITMCTNSMLLNSVKIILNKYQEVRCHDVRDVE